MVAWGASPRITVFDRVRSVGPAENVERGTPSKRREAGQMSLKGLTTFAI